MGFVRLVLFLLFFFFKKIAHIAVMFPLLLLRKEKGLIGLELDRA